MAKTLLFNPVGVIHDRKIEIFRRSLPGWDIRCVYNRRYPWFAGRKADAGKGIFFFRNDDVPQEALEGVEAVILFTAQPRVPQCNLVQRAALLGIPVIAIEEAYQMALECLLIDEYSLPVDWLFVASDYERSKFSGMGSADESIVTTGCMFRYTEPRPSGENVRADLKKRFGLSAGKAVATLSLAYPTMSGETMEVRKKLLELAHGGLPGNYELAVKPHPAETDGNLEAFVRTYAPSAKILDRFAPIEQVLDVTDVLLNRGNSQVTIDALQRNIPVVIIPAGLKTIFHDAAREIVAEERGDISRALDNIKKAGMRIYDPFFRDHLHIGPADALRNTIDGIIRIAGKKQTRRVNQRMAELSIFWEWMGYRQQAIRLIDRIREKEGRGSYPDDVRNFIVCAHDRKYLERVEKIYEDKPVVERLLQSLYIKDIYIKGKKMDPDIAERLADYPPRTNRETFINYAVMLYWCLVRSGMKPQADALVSRLNDEFGFTKKISRINNHSKTNNPFYRMAVSLDFKTQYMGRLVLKNMLLELSTRRIYG